MTFTAVLLIHWLSSHIKVDTIQTRSNTNKQEKSIPLIPDYFSPPSKRGGKNKMHLLSRTKSFLGDKHEKFNIFSPNEPSYFSTIRIFLQRRLLLFLQNIWFLCNFIQMLLAPNTIRTKLQQYCLDLKSEARHPGVSSLSALQSSYSLSAQTSVARWKLTR